MVGEGLHVVSAIVAKIAEYGGKRRPSILVKMSRW